MLARWFFRYAFIAPFLALLVMLTGVVSGMNWLLALGMAIWFSLTPVLLWLWFFTGRGDGDWPFGPRLGGEPRFYGPEVRHLMTLQLGLFAALFSVGLMLTLVFGLFDTSRIAELPEGLLRFGRIALALFPILFGFSWLNALFMIETSNRTRRHWLIPHALRARRARFYENWPNVEGWG